MDEKLKEILLTERNTNMYEDDEIITAPYYYVVYLDDYSKTHIAMVKDTQYLRFLEDRFYLKECKLIEK